MKDPCGRVRWCRHQCGDRAGANAFRGSAFGFFQDAELTKRDVFAELNDLPKPDTSQQQFGGTLGGPYPRSRAFLRQRGARQDR
jgi:hypothetical protein